ncbi:Cathepsin propeptide inhibitor domain (I29) [Trinorchestia longiramus]|nr:Cathepsin propeptide inhibitor domain (I29) [Trinorchestia longiramus]
MLEPVQSVQMMVRPVQLQVRVASPELWRLWLDMLHQHAIVNITSSQLLRPDVMNLGKYNEETKQYEKTETVQVYPEKSNKEAGGLDKKEQPLPMLGGLEHDKEAHGQSLLGRDGHDAAHHIPVLGGDDHDLVPHDRPIFGGDDHDKVPHQHTSVVPRLAVMSHQRWHHRRPIYGAGDHDKKPHSQRLLGLDGHDTVPHRRPILGGDDHDKVPHQRRTLIGGDDHDRVPHRRPILGGDDHDRVPHHRPNFGGDDHDKVPHRVNALFSFQSFMREHDKKYDTPDEFRNRFSIFRQNLQRVKQLRRSEQGSATYGVTKFADLTEEEFSKMLGFKPELRRPSERRQVVTEIPKMDLPDSYDWRSFNVVTPVKKQGMCGSCWAFSTTGNVEGQWSLKHNELLSLSEQELIDCDKEDHGCEGGLPENAYEAIEKLGGLETEDQYPYNGHDGTCHMEKTKVKVQVNGSVELPTDEGEIAQWLFKNGPVSIGLNANALQFYTGGVSHPMRFLCNPKGINHGVLIVGYGTHVTKYLHRKQPYWLIKNSWGTNWGEQGYFRMYRGDGTCGLNLMATSAIVL